MLKGQNINIGDPDQPAWLCRVVWITFVCQGSIAGFVIWLLGYNRGRKSQNCYSSNSSAASVSLIKKHQDLWNIDGGDFVDFSKWLLLVSAAFYGSVSCCGELHVIYPSGVIRGLVHFINVKAQILFVLNWLSWIQERKLSALDSLVSLTVVFLGVVSCLGAIFVLIPVNYLTEWDVNNGNYKMLLWDTEEENEWIRNSMERRMNQSYQDAICGALVAAMCYMKVRDRQSSPSRSQPITRAEPVLCF